MLAVLSPADTRQNLAVRPPAAPSRRLHRKWLKIEAELRIIARRVVVFLAGHRCRSIFRCGPNYSAAAPGDAERFTADAKFAENGYQPLKGNPTADDSNRSKLVKEQSKIDKMTS